MEKIENWREALPDYQDREDKLKMMYNGSQTKRLEDPSDKRREGGECRGSRNFASTLRVALKRTGDAEVATAVYDLLGKIVDMPLAGTVSRDLRNLIMGYQEPVNGYSGALGEAVRTNPDLITDLDELCERLKEYRNRLDS